MKRSRTCINIQELVKAPKRSRSAPCLPSYKASPAGATTIADTVGPPHFKLPWQGAAPGGGKPYYSVDVPSCLSGGSGGFADAADTLVGRLRGVSLRSRNSSASLRLESFPIMEHPKEDLEDDDDDPCSNSSSVETFVPAFGSGSGSGCPSVDASSDCCDPAYFEMGLGSESDNDIGLCIDDALSDDGDMTAAIAGLVT